MPSYFALFAGGVGATIILAVASMLGIIATSVTEGDAVLINRLRLGWIIHLIALCGVVAFYNL